MAFHHGLPIAVAVRHLWSSLSCWQEVVALLVAYQILERMDRKVLEEEEEEEEEEVEVEEEEEEVVVVNRVY